MNATQRTAWLLVSYDEAVRATDHGRYFSDFGVGVAADTRAAFTGLHLETQRQILDEAIQRYVRTPGETGFAWSPSPFPPCSRPGYSDLDGAYLATGDCVREAFFAFVASNQAQFLALEE